MVEKTEIQPAFGAVDGFAGHGHAQQQEQRKNEKGPGCSPEMPVIDSHAEHHDAEARAAPQHLLVEVGIQLQSGGTAQCTGGIKVDGADKEKIYVAVV